MVGRSEKFLSCLALLVLLSACAEMPKNTAGMQPPPNLENMLAQASSASSAGQSEKAIAQLKSAVASFPADKKPWLQLAQLNFDSANYGDAIINALEALQRDPADKLANSIVAVSGLRLSTKALADLSLQNNLSGTVRTEAQDLAKLLRESLGEAVLVPVRGKVNTPSGKSAAPLVSSGIAATGATTSRSATGKGVVAAGKAAIADVQKADSNPFGSLK